MELYHTSPCWNEDSIREHGLEIGRSCPADQKANRNTTGDPHDRGEDEFLEEPIDSRAQWEFDELLTDAQYATDNKHLPLHDSGIFFFPTKRQVERTAKNVGWSGTIVKVDSDDLPDDCTCARGDYDMSEEMYSAIKAQFSDFSSSHFTDEELYEKAQEYWEDSCDPTKDDCTVTRSDEIWCGCDIPPGIIEFV